MTSHNALTLSTILQKFKEKHGNTYDYSLITEENYRLNGSKVNIICRIHGVYSQCRGHHSSGSGCPKCGIKRTNKKNSYSYDEVKRKFKEKHGNTYDYSLVKYNGYKRKIDIICPKHGVFSQTPEGHINSNGCQQCFRENTEVHNKYNYIDTITKFNDIHGKKYDYSLIKNISAHDNINIICPKHGVFSQKAYSHMGGHGCSKCALVGPSLIEIKIHKLLEDLNVDFIKSDRSILNPKELDILIPSHNIAIECNGLYWHSSKFKDKYYHINKTIECKKNNITLLQFWEHEINDKFPIVKSMITSRLSQSKNTIYARNTYISAVDNITCKKFEELNHLQGYTASSIKLGLYHENKLVAVMTFGKPRFNKNYEWELIRFCSMLNTNIIGGASKLFKHFIKYYLKTDEKVITYANNRYSTGHLYEILKFKKIHYSEPSYFYKGKNNDIIPRYKAQKHKLSLLLNDNFDENLTEEENMNNNSYYRIYDCGNSVYEYINQ